MARKKSISDIQLQLRRIQTLANSIKRSVGQRRRRARSNEDYEESYRQWQRGRNAILREGKAMSIGQKYVDNIIKEQGGYVNASYFKKFPRKVYMGLSNG